MIKLKRIYEPADAADGARLLVERLWPRGISKERAQVRHWFKEVAPSPALRQWYGHEVAKWPEFRRRYEAELAGHAALLAEIERLAQAGTVTFVYAASDEAHNSAVVLKEYLERSR